ncbi:hypothetical protein JTB14_002719 [Gonioctena quinquepunctata]|nr:hypothetical protein JTB14_002719 [Gonioctena quinquepunctata]
MEASKVQIGLLEGKSNRSTWKYKLCILLRGVKGGLEVLEGKLQAPKPLVENASQEEKSRSRDVIFDECKPLEIDNENKNEYHPPLPQDNVLDYVKSKDSSKNEEVED